MEGSTKKKEGRGEGRRFSLKLPDKVIHCAVGVLVVMIIAMSLLMRVGWLPIRGDTVLYLPLLAVVLLIAWGILALVRRLSNRLVRGLAGGLLGLALMVVMVIASTYISYMSFYVAPHRFTVVTSPSGREKLVVMRAFDTDEGRMEARRAARLAGREEADGEESIEDWGYIYRAYPQALNFFYKSNADVEGEVYLAIDNVSTSPDDPEAAAGEAGPDSDTAGAVHHGTLMVEWLDDEKTARFYVSDPGVAEGGECLVHLG